MHKIYLPTIQQMKLFEAVARLRSVTRAAEEVSLTQPSVSMQVKALEEKIGMPLIDQIGKNLFLTRAGEEVASTSREILDRLDVMKTNLASVNNEIAGSLNLAVVTTTKYFLPQRIGEFKQRYPGVEPRVNMGNREQIMQRLANNLDDVYIMGTPPDQKVLAYAPISTNEIVFVAHPYHPLAALPSMTLDQLLSADIISRERGSGTRQAIERRFAENGLQLNPLMEFEDSEAIKLAAISGLGIAYLPIQSMRLELAARELVILNVQGFPLKRQWYAMHHRAKHLSRVAERFLEFLQEPDADKIIHDSL
ncbi:MAG: LysR family transcriptional regulator [Litorivicinaceae bacterium]|nr:LysR family transcriptional regulator [Litorivicinaceae bacterium]